MSAFSLVLGMGFGLPGSVPAACAVLSLDERTGTIGLFRPADPVRRDSLAVHLASDPLLADSRLRLIALTAPLTPRPLERKPWRARAVEIRLSRGTFASSLRGPNMPWISRAHSWSRYEQALGPFEILQARGFPLLAIPAEAPAAELPLRCTAEVFPKASLAVLGPRTALLSRPGANEFLGHLDDWLFPQLFTAPERGSPPIEARLAVLVPGLRLAPEVLDEVRRIANLRRPDPRRAPLRAFLAAFQGVLALCGGACLVGAAGDHEGSVLLPSLWHPEWETEWSDFRREVPELRRVPVNVHPR
ncbi:MAG TPA: hypothetical protein VKM72_14555 [Thermoanaerobaculia bacterium]|nr:hypothetical protein [Thermoanaerobaculia bacterium]